MQHRCDLREVEDVVARAPGLPRQGLELDGRNGVAPSAGVCAGLLWLGVQARAVRCRGRRRTEVLEGLVVLVSENVKLRRRIFQPVGDGTPAFIHAFDDAGRVRSAEHGVRVCDCAGSGDEITSDDLVQLGAVWIFFVVELGLRLGVPVVVLVLVSLLRLEWASLNNLSGLSWESW